MDFIAEFKKRGYFYQCTDEVELSNKMKNGPVACYIGFDCTAESLHVGNLMQIMIMRLLQKHGHKPIVLVGGATTKIGDPTGKDKTRQMLTDEQILQNMRGIKRSLEKFIRFGDGPSDAIMLNNSDWLEQIGYVEFLRNMGKEFSVNKMLTMESVKARLEREQHLTFLEFNYMLLQAYDFHYLNDKYNCAVQIGGSDQWGNIIMGVDLIKKVGSKKVGSFGLTTPLLTTSSGKKMGKSEGGAVWINAEQLPPYDYFQYWRNIEDADIVRFAKLYCEYSDEELQQLEEMSKQDVNAAKKKLAHRVTSLCHGEEEADKALQTSIDIFEQGKVAADLPVLELNKDRVQEGLSACELLHELELTKSKGEARKLIRGNGVKINGEVVEDENLTITDSLFDQDGLTLSIGKKRHLRVKLV